MNRGGATRSRQNSCSERECPAHGVALYSDRIDILTMQIGNNSMWDAKAHQTFFHQAQTAPNTIHLLVSLSCRPPLPLPPTKVCVSSSAKPWEAIRPLTQRERKILSFLLQQNAIACMHANSWPPAFWSPVRPSVVALGRFCSTTSTAGTDVPTHIGKDPVL